MAREIAGIPYEELIGSGKISINSQGLSGVRIFKVAWEDHLEFAKELRDPVWTDGGWLFPKPSRAPWILQDGTVMIADDVDISGMGQIKGDDDIAWDFARLDVSYVPESSLLGGLEGEITREYTAEYIVHPPDTWWWADANGVHQTKIPGTVGQKVCYTEITLTFKSLTSINEAVIRELQGTCNDQAFLGYERGEVLFLGASSSLAFGPDEDNRHDLILKFKARAIDWNFKKKKDGLWYLVVDQDDVEMYFYKDLEELLNL